MSTVGIVFGVIGGIVGILILVGIGVGIYFYVRARQRDARPLKGHGRNGTEGKIYPKYNNNSIRISVSGNVASQNIGRRTAPPVPVPVNHGSVRVVNGPHPLPVNGPPPPVPMHGSGMGPPPQVSDGSGCEAPIPEAPTQEQGGFENNSRETPEPKRSSGIEDRNDRNGTPMPPPQNWEGPQQDYENLPPDNPVEQKPPPPGPQDWEKPGQDYENMPPDDNLAPQPPKKPEKTQDWEPSQDYENLHVMDQ